VHLTEAGVVFLNEVQQIFRQLQQAIQVGQQTSRGELGQLAIGFVSSAAYNILPTILRTFRNCVPGVSLELHELTTDQQLEWLRTGRIDVGFVRLPVEENTFSWETIFQESLMVALPEGHLLANQSHICLRSLANEPFILFPRILAPGLYDLIITPGSLIFLRVSKISIPKDIFPKMSKSLYVRNYGN
jgi:DNA-binding transcriptional LysR family regulator